MKCDAGCSGEGGYKESLRGKGPVYVFRDAGVEMRDTRATTLAEALAEASQA